MNNWLEAKIEHKPKTQIASTLQRLAESNPHRSTGPGIYARHYLPLCRYHNRNIAAELCARLEENAISVKATSTRMYVSISVAFENRAEAFRMLDEFKESHADTLPRKFSRDYDLVFLIAFATLVVTAMSFSVSPLGKLIPFALMTNGISLCILVERWHRSYRYRNGWRFSLREILEVTIICAVNCAIWRIAI